MFRLSDLGIKTLSIKWMHQIAQDFKENATRLNKQFNYFCKQVLAHAYCHEVPPKN